MYLYFVRHGQSEGNVLRTFHGQMDYPLTDLGREQARQSADKLREISFARCCASDLSRAWDTALICVEGRNIPVESCPGLREQFVGEMEGLSWDQMGENFPGLRERYIDDWDNTIPPGGESAAQMAARVNAAVDEIVARGEDTLVVAHFGSLFLTFRHLGLVAPEEELGSAWVFGQGVFSAVRIEGGKTELICFNQ